MSIVPNEAMEKAMRANSLLAEAANLMRRDRAPQAARMLDELATPLYAALDLYDAETEVIDVAALATKEAQ